MKRSTLLAASIAAAFVISVPNVALAQRFANPRGRYFPLDQETTPGVVAQWNTLSRGTRIGTPQAVRIDAPKGTTVSFYSGLDETQVQPSPAQVKLAVGHIYRLKLSNIPGMPNVMLYPSVEVLDQLHPPAGMEDRYPVPIAITAKELKAAAQGRFVTKVIYLEAPRRAVAKRRSQAEATTTMPNNINLFAEADRLGRPMMILRIGSRTPSPGGPNSFHFYGSGGPIMPSAMPVQTPAPAKEPAKPVAPKAAAVGRVRITLAQTSPSVGK